MTQSVAPPEVVEVPVRKLICENQLKSSVAERGHIRDISQMKSSSFKPVQEEDTIDGTLMLSKRLEIHPVTAIYSLSGTLHFHSRNAARKVSTIEPELEWKCFHLVITNGVTTASSVPMK